MNEFLNSDNENSLVYNESIMEDVNDLINGITDENGSIGSSDDDWEKLLRLILILPELSPNAILNDLKLSIFEQLAINFSWQSGNGSNEYNLAVGSIWLIYFANWPSFAPISIIVLIL